MNHLEKINLIPTDQLIFLGDYVDGWSESPQVIDCLIQLNENYNNNFFRLLLFKLWVFSNL